MNVRNYNIFFHTHTISGIIISALLYVIFFAGSFSFFKNEISAWQHNKPLLSDTTDFNTILDSLHNTFNLQGRDISLYLSPHRNQIGVNIDNSKDTLNTKKDSSAYFSIDPKTFKVKTYKENYDLGEFLYRLHFFAQLNIGRAFPLGYFISGLVAVFFLFALITGILVHWEKIISNFYLFRPWEKLKTVWTDLHTALGVISFPFMLVFSITGAYFMIHFTIFSAPVAAIEYKGDDKALYKDLGYGEEEYNYTYKPLQSKTDVNHIISITHKSWGEDVEINSIELINYGDSSMRVVVEGALPSKKKMISNGELIYSPYSDQIIKNSHPSKPNSYTDVVDNLLYTLHFGNYGGATNKFLYFLLGICGCIVINSGVMIWLVARDKKNIPARKRKFNFWLANIYLSISMSMIPVTAIAFVVVKLYPDCGMGFIYRFYFWSWLAISNILIAFRSINKVNNITLFSGALIGITIPIFNGVVTGNWFWKTATNHHRDILMIDVFWILLSTCLFICWWLSIKKQKKVLTEKNKNG